ncbi:MAG: hypothetical protein IKW74_03175, partial [Thermoguttaceae bacterium]|nr:hypothetical protein [Thermoguttaceae bacterium]
LGWNPIQSGDYAGNRSKVIEFKQRTSDSFYVKTIPMLWPHANLPAECTFECLYTLKDNYFILDATINNNRSDRTQYPADNQEMPAVYTNGPWYRLVTYLGTKPFENEPVTVVFDKGDNKGWPCPGYYTPERWSALLDENGYGIGVYQGDSTFMSGGFAGGDAAKGTGGEKDGQTGYITPFSPVILDWNICKTYRTVFILGTVDEIRQKANEIALSTLPKIPRWDFDSGRENWYYTGQMKDSGYPLSQCLDVSFNGDTDNAMVGPQTFWKAEDTKNLEIDAMFTGDGDDETDNGISEEQELTISISPVSPYDCTDHLRWSDAGHSMDEETEVKLKMFPILPDIIVKVPVKFNGGRQVWSVDLSVFEKYTGAMKGLKISFPPVAGRAKIYGIRFTEK